MSIFAEAFSALNLVEAKDFKVGIKEDEKALLDFMNDDTAEDDTVDVIDPEAVAKEDGEELDDNDHTGDVICRCPECQSLIFFTKDDLVKSDDDEDLVNVDEECPYCKTIHGFVVIGEVAPLETDEVEVADKAEDEEAPKDEEPKEDDDEPIDEAFDSIKGGLKGAGVGAAIGSIAGPMGTLVGSKVGNAIGKTVGAIKGATDKIGGDKKDEEPVAESVEECGKFDKLPSRKMHESKKRIDSRNHSLKEAKEVDKDAKAQKLKDKPTKTTNWFNDNAEAINKKLGKCATKEDVIKVFTDAATKGNMLEDGGVKKVLAHLPKTKSLADALMYVSNFMLAGQGLGMGRFNSNPKRVDLNL